MNDDISAGDKVRIASLKECPVQITLCTEKFVEGIARTAKNNLDDIPPVTVAKLNDELYIVDGHTRIRGCSKAGVQEIRIAQAIEAKDINDVIIAHIRRNYHNFLDPAKLNEAFKLLQVRGLDGKDLNQDLLWLHNAWINSGKSIQEITRKGMDMVLEFVEELKLKHRMVHVPFHFYDEIGAIQDKQKQEYIISKILEYLRDNARNEKTFSFQTRKALQALIIHFSTQYDEQFGLTVNTAKKDEEEKQETKEIVMLHQINEKDGSSVETVDQEPDIVEVKDDDNASPDRKTHRPQHPRFDSTIPYERAKEILRDTPYNTPFQCECGRIYGINVKESTCVKIDERNGTLVLEGYDPVPDVLHLPREQFEFIGANVRKLGFYKFETFNALCSMEGLPDAAKKENVRYLLVVAE